MQQTGNTILITGGGLGIGAALAQRLNDQDRFEVALAAISAVAKGRG